MRLGSFAWPWNNQWQLLQIGSLWLWPNSWNGWLQTDNVCPSKYRLGREVPRQDCHWCNTSVRTLSTKLSFSKHFYTAVWEYIPWGTLNLCSAERPRTPSSLQGWAVCVIWGGHWVPYHSCSLCTVALYGEFTLRHVRAKWCRLIWCHLLMP